MSNVNDLLKEAIKNYPGLTKLEFKGADGDKFAVVSFDGINLDDLDMQAFELHLEKNIGDHNWRLGMGGIQPIGGGLNDVKLRLFYSRKF